MRIIRAAPWSRGIFLCSVRCVLRPHLSDPSVVQDPSCSACPVIPAWLWVSHRLWHVSCVEFSPTHAIQPYTSPKSLGFVLALFPATSLTCGWYISWIPEHTKENNYSCCTFRDLPVCRQYFYFNLEIQTTAQRAYGVWTLILRFWAH